jgi:hypothetical protein
MTDELKPVKCGCGGEAEIGQRYLMGNLPDIYVICGNCSIRTGEYYSEAEAIQAWNRAMSSNVQECAENARCNERTAKVTTVEKPIEGSIRTISVMACENCDSVVSIFDSYCSGCGARLEWDE